MERYFHCGYVVAPICCMVTNDRPADRYGRVKCAGLAHKCYRKASYVVKRHNARFDETVDGTAQGADETILSMKHPPTN